MRVVTNDEEARREIQELVAKKADFVKVWQDSRRQLMPRPVIEFLIAGTHRNNLRVVAHTHALSDFKHLLRSGIDAFAHPTWRQTEVDSVDDELIALFKAHANVPVMPGFWTPRKEPGQGFSTSSAILASIVTSTATAPSQRRAE